MNIDFHQLVTEGNSGEVLFSFQGELTSTRITSLLEEMEIRLDELEIELKLRKKVYYVFVESIQNLFHHSILVHLNGSINKDLRLCSIALLKIDDYYSIVTGNFVKEEKVNEIASHIEEINSYSKEELKDYYKEILTNQEFSVKGGGGLGMIDIARKANGKYQYSFSSFKKDIAFFKLQININQN